MKVKPKLDFIIVDGRMVKSGDPEFTELEKKYCKEIDTDDIKHEESKEEEVNEQGASKANSK